MKNCISKRTRSVSISLFSLFVGAALYGTDYSVGTDTLWDTPGTVGGNAYTAADKIHIRSTYPNAIPTVTFDIGSGNDTTLDAVVLGWTNGNATSAGNLIMDSGKLITGGFSVGIPVVGSESVASDARLSTLVMNAGTELVIVGKDDGGGDYNGFFIAKTGGTPNDSFRTTASASMTNAKLTFASDLTNRTSILSVGQGRNSDATFSVTGGSVISQNTVVSGTNQFNVRIGEGENSHATMLLSGTGTHLDLSTGGAIQDNDGFTIGHAKDSVATVLVDNGAKISQDNTSSGAMRIILGRGDNAKGTLTVDGTGTVVDFSSSGENEVLQIGRGTNATGTLNITGGAEVSNRNDVGGAADMYMGKSAGSTGNLNVIGTDSLFRLEGDKRLFVGGVSGATGNVLVQNGAKFELNAKGIAIGHNGGTGTLTVDNAVFQHQYTSNPDFVIARTAGSTGTVEVKNGGVIENVAGNMTIYLGGDYDNRNNATVSTATLKVHGENSKIIGANSSSLLVGYSKNSVGTSEIYNKASITFRDIGIAVGEGTNGSFKMWGGATATVTQDFNFATQMTSSSQGVSTGYAEITGKDTALAIARNLTMGTNDSAKTGTLELAIGDGAHVSVGGTLSVNYGSTISFNVGGNDLGNTTALLSVNNFNFGDTSVTSLDINGSDEAAVALGDFQIFLLEYNNTNAATQSDIEALVAINGFDSKYFNVGALEWNGNRLYLNLSVINAIPEPGTYAVIFGTIALALAIRRRKQN